jgi:DNA-directed RNA polymerase, mitochondrial
MAAKFNGTIAENEVHEKQMLLDGQKRFEERKQKRIKQGVYSLQSEPNKLIERALPKVSVAIIEMVTEAISPAKGKPFDWESDVAPIDPAVLSYIGLTICFNCVFKNQSMTTALSMIGERIELEHWFVGLVDFDGDLAKRIKTQVTKTHSSQVYRIKAARFIAKKAGYFEPKWTKKRAVKAGTPVLNAVLKASDLFELFDAAEDEVNNTRWTLGLTEAGRQAICDLEDLAEWANPAYRPMLVPPRPWVGMKEGGYYDPELAATTHLVRGVGREHRMAIEHKISTGNAQWLDAINAIQATSLQINKFVLGVINFVLDEGLNPNKMPVREYAPFPKMPDGELDDFTKAYHRKRQRKWRQHAREVDVNLINLGSDLRQAAFLSEHEKVYLPWSMDFRGRMYPIPHFSYHRTDYCKALWSFAEGVPAAGVEGWLKIHLANTGDFNKISKRSMDERNAWVDQHHDQILAVADDYAGTYNWWSTADSPFQFVAACEEYARMVRDGDEYRCYLPISFDGTNSGIQHYAAACRAEEDAALVNLVPAKEVADVYAAVAAVSRRLLEQEGSESAKLWLSYGVDRSTVKRNVMTYGYSSVERGFADQLSVDIMDKLTRDHMNGVIPTHPFGDPKEQAVHCRTLAKANYAAVQEVVSSVASAMSYLQEIAGLLSAENKTVRWETPAGFPVVQGYYKEEREVVRISLWDRKAKFLRRSKVTIQIDERERVQSNLPPKIDSRRMRSAIAPNFVHSLDAAHMQMTVYRCLNEGVSRFFMIHDSFATDIEQTWSLFANIRAAFVDQYREGCVFEGLENMTRQRLKDVGAELPKIPEKGLLDIENVMLSTYCFS